MNPLDSILAHYPIVILDGALATELERAGCNLNDPLWSAKILLEEPALIQEIHANYLVAGADCLITATYQATFQGFGRRGIDQSEATRLMQLAVQLAVDARDQFWANPAHQIGRPKPIIAASIGPYGAFLANGSEYRGDYGLSEQELIDFHHPRLAVLAATQADIFAFETVPCLVEAQALAHLLQAFPGKVGWISFTVKDEAHISSGESFADCLEWLNDYPQIVAVGVNCSPPQFMLPLIEQAVDITTKPIVIYPNSGEAYDTANREWTGLVEGCNYEYQTQHWHQAGATIIGGCCRTTPADIAQIATWARTKL